MKKKRIYRDEKVEVFREGEDLLLVFTQPHMLRIPSSDRQAINDEVIRMIKMRTVKGYKYFVQQEVGKIIGVSRQMINRRWQIYQNDGLLALLSGERKKHKINPELLDRLAELVVENPFLFAHEIKEKLEAEGFCEEISISTLYIAIRQMDGRKLIMLMRNKTKQAKKRYTRFMS